MVMTGPCLELNLCANHDLPRSSRGDYRLATDNGYGRRVAFVCNVVRLEVEHPSRQTAVDVVQPHVNHTIAVSVIGVARVQGITTDLAPGSVEGKRRSDAPVEGEVAVVFRDSRSEERRVGKEGGSLWCMESV